MIDRSIVDFAKNLELASKSLRMYSETHPRTQIVIQETYDSILKLFEHRNSIALSVFHDNLLCDGEIVDKGSLVLTRLARELADRNVDTLKIVRGLQLEELLFLLRHLILTPQRLREMGGLEKLLEDQGFQTIQVNKVKYGIIGDEAAPGFDQTTFSELMVVFQSLLSENTDVAAVAADVERSLETNTQVDPGAILLRLFSTVAQRTPELSEDLVGQPQKEKFAQLYHSFTPAMQSRLLMTSLLSEPSGKQSGSFHSGLTAEEFEKSVLTLLDQPLPEDQLKELASRLQSAEDLLVTEKIIQKLREKDLLVPETASLTPSLSEELFKKESWSVADIEKIPDALQELIGQGKVPEADQLSKKAFALIGNGKPEQKKAAIESLPVIIRVLSRHEKWKNVEFSLSFLISTCYRKEASEDVLRAFIPYLISIFMKNYDSSSWSNCADVLTTIGTQTERYGSVKEEFASSWIRTAEAFIEHLREGWTGVEVVVDGFKLAGSTGISYLIDLLADEEDQKVRSRLINAIVSFSGELISSEVERRMSDPRWFVVRNMVTIVGKLNSAELPEFLERAAVHPDPRVPKELIKILYKGNSKSQLPLILLLMQHPDKNIRIQAVHLVTMQANSGAIPALVDLLNSGAPAESDLRTACLQALLKLRSLEGLVPAATLLDRKPSSKVEIAERNAAVRLLGELAREQMRSVLEKTAQTDPHPETRSVAASYL